MEELPDKLTYERTNWRTTLLFGITARVITNLQGSNYFHAEGELADQKKNQKNPPKNEI